MKRSINLVMFLFLTVAFSACKKEDFNYPEGYVGRSKITTYATFTMAGEQYQSVVRGGTYTEAGVTAKEGETDLQVTTSGTVDVNTPGLYVLNYSATNKDGFPASTSRYIAVLPAAEQPGVDISGSYSYAPTPTAKATITKLAPGFYQTSNLWSAATTISAFIITVDGVNLTLPAQTTGFGRLQGTATRDVSGKTLNYVVDLLDQGITGSTRRWLID